MENQFLVVGSLLPVASEADAPPPLAPTTFYTVYSSTQAYLQQHTTRVISDFGVLATSSAHLATTPSSMSGMVIETSTCPTIIDDKMRKEMESWKGKKENASWQSSVCVKIRNVK